MAEEADLILRAEQAISQTRKLGTEVDRLRDMYRDAREDVRRAHEEMNALRTTAALEARAYALRAVRRSLTAWAIFVLCWTLVDAYIAINVHEVYRDHCDSMMIAKDKDRPHWCDWVFLFDDNGASTMSS